MKDVGMRIRVEPELREQFISLCHVNNVPAAQVLRSFMRDFIHANAVKPSDMSAKKNINSKLRTRTIATKTQS